MKTKQNFKNAWLDSIGLGFEMFSTKVDVLLAKNENGVAFKLKTTFDLIKLAQLGRNEIP